MATAKILLYRNKKNDKNIYPLALRITKDRKPRYSFLGVSLKEEDWDPIDKRVKRSHPNYKRINNLILKRLTSIDDLILESEANQTGVTSLQLKKKLKGEMKGVNFFAFADSRINSLNAQGKFKQAISEKAQIKNFKTFFNGEEVSFNDITVSVLERFKIYLKSIRKSKSRTIANHLICIRSIFNKAIKDEIVDIKHYPFGGEKITIKIPAGIKIGLDEKEVVAIEKLDLAKGSTINHTRNVWLISFYFAGMRISDVLTLRWNDFADNRLYYSMDKNEKPVSIKIPEKVIEILKQYEHQKQSIKDFIFPDLKTADPNDKKDLYVKANTANRKFNRYLKKIAKLADINKNLSSHIARHSFGNMAGDRISPQMLQKLYRHSDIRTTMGYQANFIHKDADEALDKVLEY